jgi:hypothetical protein
LLCNLSIVLSADSDFYEERLEAVRDGHSAPGGDSAVRQAVLASSTSQPSSLANSPPLSPRAPQPASGASGPACSQGGNIPKEKEMVSFDGGLSIPAALYDRLFSYQQVGVQWMWELHMQRTGGVVLQSTPIEFAPFCSKWG